MPQVSVIIPTYNRAALVCDAIDSVLAQSAGDFEITEIIVADDGSTDDTATALARFGSPVRHLPLPHRGQPAAARNAGLAASTGSYIAFLDSDDLFLPDKLARQVAALEAQPHVGLVYSNGYYFAHSPTETSGTALDGLPSPSGHVFDDLLRGNFIMTPALTLIRRAWLENAGGFNESPDLIAVEDYDLWLRLAARGEFQFVPGYVAAIRRHETNLSASLLRHRQRLDTMRRQLAQQQPALIAAHRAAHHEGHARNHGGIAAIALRQRQWSLATRHTTLALWHTLQLPGMGMGTVRAWWRRRRLRTAAY